jgi:DNA-binding transcriptional ArsR family regulator
VIVRFPLVVAVATLTALAGLAVAQPLAALDVAAPVSAHASVPALETPRLVASALDAAPPALPSIPVVAKSIPMIAARAVPATRALAVPATDLEDEEAAPFLLLPDGLATLPRGAAEDFSSFSFAPSVPLPPASASRVAPLAQTIARQAPSADPVGPPAPPGAASDAGVSAASGHAFVSAAPSSVAAIAAGGAALGLLGLAGFALYHRIRPHATLENDTRKAIFEAVCETPGLGVHVISERARVSYSTATYHLERLVAAGMIVMTPDGNKLCYYKNGGAFTESERKILPLVKNEEAARLLEAILDTPGTYRAALAERLGVTATTINWHLRRLREAGLIDETRQGRNAYLYVRSAAARESFLSLAAKVETTDSPVAERLRRFASVTTTEGRAA